MSTTNKENENSLNESTATDSGLAIKHENLNQAIKVSPYRKKIANKNFEQLEAVTQKLLNDFGIKKKCLL